MKIGIISFAHMHAHSYASSVIKIDGAQLVGIADDDKDRGIKAAQQYGTTFFDSYEELLHKDIDAVIVTSENSKHKEFVIAAANAGKHVLCEKPIATTLQDAKEMIKACEGNHVILQTAFPVRFNTAIRRAKNIIDEGKLGRILAIKGTNRGTNPGGWFVDPEKSGGGAVMDHTVHVVDIMRWFMNAEIREVYAEIGTQMISDIDIDDVGIVTLEFNNGVFATLDCSWSRNKTYPTWGDVTVEVIGTGGTITVDAFAQKIDVYSNEDGAAWSYWGDDMDFELMKDFIQTVKEGKQPSITGYDGMMALEAALAAYQSYDNKTPVCLR